MILLVKVVVLCLFLTEAFFCFNDCFASGIENEPIKIFTSILPQKYFAQQIGGELVDVEVLVQPGMSPHTFNPSPGQMSRLVRARAFFAIGLPFENNLIERIKSIAPDTIVVMTDDNIKKRRMNSSEECDSCFGHSHGALDPHIWLDPILAKTISVNIASELLEMAPEHKEYINKRLNKLSDELEKLEKELSEALKHLKGETMLVFHPAFGYFADRFGLIQVAIEMEGKEPSPRQLAQIIRTCRKNDIRVVFVQKQFPVTAAETIAKSINGQVIQIDPLAENYVKNLKEIASKVSFGMQK